MSDENTEAVVEETAVVEAPVETEVPTETAPEAVVESAE